jgi:hypothetical protein
MPIEESSTSFKEVNADPLTNMGPKQGLQNIINNFKAKPSQLTPPPSSANKRRLYIPRINEKIDF